MFRMRLSKVRHGADVSVHRLLAEALAGSRRIYRLDADFIGIIGREVPHLMAGAALTACEKEGGAQSRSHAMPGNGTTEGVAVSQPIGVHAPAGRPVKTPRHRRKSFLCRERSRP